MILFVVLLSLCESLECPNNTYIENDSCIDCSVYCKEGKCGLENGCVECIDYFDVENKTCVSSCSTNTYFNGNECVECSERCIEMYCDKLKGCTLCDLGYIPFNKTCVDNSCGILCEVGYCNNTSCSQCIEGYILFNNNCIDDSCENCEFNHCTKGYCGDCKEGYYLYHSKCWKCPSNCSINGCEDGYGCTECVKGMHLQGGICVNDTFEEEEFYGDWKIGAIVVGSIFGVLLVLNGIIVTIYVIKKLKRRSYTSLKLV